MNKYDKAMNIFYKTFNLDTLFDVTDIFEKSVFVLLESLILYYVDEIIYYSAFNNKEYTRTRVYKLISTFHDICMYRCDAVDFMLFCDVLNTINKEYDIDCYIYFDDYSDIENAVYEITTFKHARIIETLNKFHDYSYSYINVMKYALQYERLYY